MKSKDISKNIPQHYAQIVDALSVIKKVSSENSMQVFLIGALARDIILKYQYNIDKEWRATEDIDLAININGWDNYKKLTEILISKYKFEPESNIIAHRFKYKGTILVDILPYGSIAGNDGSVFLPPEFTSKISVIGFNEVYNFTECLKLSEDPELEINIASLPGLVILKLFSWDEKYPERKHDASDIGIIMKNYIDAGNQERFTDSDLLEEKDFDYDIGVARLLGRDIKSICSEKTLTALLEILDRRTDLFAKEIEVTNDIDFAIEIVNGLIMGMKE